MSAINSVSSAAAYLSHLLQAPSNKQQADAPTSPPTQASHPAANDPDHDGDSHGGGINVTA